MTRRQQNKNKKDTNFYLAKSQGFISLGEAATLCNYSQEYLSLLARRKLLRAEKFGRNWFTKAEWLKKYIEDHPEDLNGNTKGKLLSADFSVPVMKKKEEPYRNKYNNLYSKAKEHKENFLWFKKFIESVKAWLTGAQAFFVGLRLADKKIFTKRILVPVTVMVVMIVLSFAYPTRALKNSKVLSLFWRDVKGFAEEIAEDFFVENFKNLGKVGGELAGQVTGDRQPHFVLRNGDGLVAGMSDKMEFGLKAEWKRVVAYKNSSTEVAKILASRQTVVSQLVKWDQQLQQTGAADRLLAFLTTGSNQRLADEFFKQNFVLSPIETSKTINDKTKGLAHASQKVFDELLVVLNQSSDVWRHFPKTIALLSRGVNNGFEAVFKQTENFSRQMSLLTLKPIAVAGDWLINQPIKLARMIGLGVGESQTEWIDDYLALNDSYITFIRNNKPGDSVLNIYQSDRLAIDWQKIKGEVGEKGERGEQGEKGERGEQGPVGPVATTSTTIVNNVYNVGTPSATASDGAGSSFAVKYLSGGNLDVSGATSLAGLTVSSVANFQDTVNMAGNLSVAGNATTTGTQYVGGDLTVAGYLYGDGSYLTGIESWSTSTAAYWLAHGTPEANLATTTIAGNFSVQDADGLSRFFVNNLTGAIGIATTTPGGYYGEKLTVAGGIYATGTSIFADARIPVLNATTTNIDTLTVNTASTLSGLSIIADARVSNLNASSSVIDNLTVTNSLVAPSGSISPSSLALTQGNIFVGNSSGYAEATSSIFIAEDGKVGIGTDSPESAVHIKGDVVNFRPTVVLEEYDGDKIQIQGYNNAIKLIANNTESAVFGSSSISFRDHQITDVGNIALDSISSENNTTILVNLGNDPGDDFIISTNKFIVKGDTGAIGIATTTPGGTYGEKLTVVGDTYLQGNATTTALRVSSLNLNGDDITDITGSGLTITDGALTVQGFAVSGSTGAWETAWENALTPTSTTAGIFVKASSTFDSTLRVNSDFTVAPGATTTIGNNALVVRGGDGRVGIGTANPVKELQINGDLLIGSDPATTHTYGKDITLQTGNSASYSYVSGSNSVNNYPISFWNNFQINNHFPGIAWSFNNANAGEPWASIYTYYGSDGKSQIRLGTTNSAASGITSEIIINGDGALGIATTTPGGTYGEKLTVVGSGYFTENLNIGGNATTTGHLSADDTLYVKDGRVGIGTQNPSYLLSVDGQSYFGDDVYLKGANGIRSTPLDSYMFISGGYHESSGDGSIFLYGHTNATYPGATIFKNNGNITMFIDGQNNIGIATTTPDAKLVVTATAGELTGNQMLFQVASTTNDSISNSLVVTADGRVGIGTDSPVYTLDIQSSDTYAYNRFKNTSGGIVGFYMENGSTKNFFGTNGSRMFFYAGDSTNEDLTILNSGSIGIATTTPTSRLTIQGAGATSATYGLNIADSTGFSWLQARDDGQLRIRPATGTDVALHILEPDGTDGMEFRTGPSGNYNLFIGENAGEDVESEAQRNTAIGYDALSSLTTADDNSAFGYSALSSLTIGTRNTAVGRLALNAITDGFSNVAIGSSASVGNTGSSNTVIGTSAGLSSLGASYDNTVIVGMEAGEALTTGDYNILLGYKAGESLTSGSNNIALGYDVELPSNTADGQMTIGNLLFGTSIDGTGTTISSGSIGIATTTPGGYFGEKITVADSALIMRESGGTENLFRVGTTTDTDIFVVKSSGNVGIGTANPSYKLHVAGDAYISGGDLYLNSNTSNGAISFASDSMTFSIYRDYVFKTFNGSTYSEALRLKGNGSQNLNYVGNGAIGIATTTPGGTYGEKLTVVGDAYITGNSTTTRLAVTGGNSDQWNTAFSWGNHADASYLTGNLFNQWLDTTNTPEFAGAYLTASTTITANATTTGHFAANDTLFVKDGKVGIGTESLGATFVVDSSDSYLFDIKNSGTSRFKMEADGDLISTGVFKTEYPNMYFTLTDSDAYSGNAFNFSSWSNVELRDSDARQAWMYVDAEVNQSGTAAYDALYINVQEDAVGDGSTGDGNNLLNLALNGTSKFIVNNLGSVGIATTTPGGYYGEKLTVAGGIYATGTSVFDDARIPVLNATTTNVDTLTVNTASTLSGLTTISDGRISVLNASTTLIDSLTLTNDLALADGGTGASLSDPDDDRLMFWDDSEDTVAWLDLGSGLSLSGTTLSAISAGSSAGSFWATTTDSLIGYPNLSGDYAIVIGGSATTSDDIKFEVIGSSKLADARISVINATTTNIDTLTVNTASTLSGLTTISDGRIAVLNATSTNIDNLTVNSSSIFSGLSTFSDARISVLNVTTTNIDTLTVNTAINLPSGSLSYQSLDWHWATSSTDYWESTQLRWATSSTDYWLTTKDTDSLAEGATNLYYTQARVWDDTWASTTLATILTNSQTAYNWGDHADASYLTGNLFNQWLDTTSTPQFAGAYLTASTTITANATTTGHFAANDTLFVKDGKVGIGTESPEKLLHISDNSSASNFAYSDIFLSKTNNAALSIQDVGGAELNLWAGPESAVITVFGSNKPLIFRTNTNQEVMRLTSSGIIGIATTTPGGYYGEKLTVAGGIYATGTSIFADARISVLNSTSTNIDTLTVNTASTLNGLTTISDGRISVLNASTTLIDSLKIGADDAITDITGTGLTISGNALTVDTSLFSLAGSTGAWQTAWSNTLTPTNTAAGIFVNASSTFNDNLRVNGDVYIAGNSTTTKAYIDAEIGLNGERIEYWKEAPLDDGYRLKDWWDTTQSAGRLTGGEITSNGDGTVDITAGTGIVKTTESDVGENSYITWDAVSSLALTDDAYNYIYYDGSDNQMKATTNFYSISMYSDFTVGRVYRTGTEVVIRLCGTNLWNFNRRVQLFGEEVFPIIRATGMLTSETGTRNIAITAGILWAELVNRFTTNAFDSSGTDTFTYWYEDGADGWTSSASQTQINNTNYDDGDGTLGTLTANRYGVHWVYMVHDSSVHVVYGQGDYKQAEAEIATPPSSLPGLLNAYATLIAKIIIQKEATSFYAVQNPFDETFTPSAVTSHNDLSNLQGGASGEYYHLTSAEYVNWQALNDGGTISLLNATTTNVDNLTVYDSSTLLGLTTLSDGRIAVLNATSTNIDNLTVNSSSIFSGLSTLSDARISVINATTTNIDTLTVNTASTLNGLTTISDGRIATLNATSSLIDDLVVNRATSTNFYTSSLGLGSDYITDLTGIGLSVVDGVLTVSDIDGSNWSWSSDQTYITPSTSVGILINASSTIDNDLRVAQHFNVGTTTPWDQYGVVIATTTIINSTTTIGSNALVIRGGDGRVGIGTASPNASLQIVGEGLFIGDSGTFTYANGDGDLFVQNEIETDSFVYADRFVPAGSNDFASYGLNRSYLYLGWGGSYDGHIRTLNNADLYLTPNGTGDTLISSGALGIATTTPGGYYGEKITVAGGIYATGTSVFADARIPVLNSTSTNIDNLTVNSSSIFSGLSTLSDARISVINATTTNIDTLTVNTASTLNGLTTISDGRISVLNASTTLIDTLTITQATSTNLYTSSLGLGSDYITDLTGTGLSVVDGVLTVSGIDGSNWSWSSDQTYITPSTSVGILINASSTIASNFRVDGAATTTGNFVVASSTADNPTLYVDALNGRVGIGTASPNSAVHIDATTAGDGGTSTGLGSALYVKQNTAWGGDQPWALYVSGYSYLNGFRINAADGMRALHKVSTGGQLGFSTQGDDPITFTQSVSQERMRIAAGGSVGIATTTPGGTYGEKLTVSGGIYATGTSVFAEARIPVLNSTSTNIDNLTVNTSSIFSGLSTFSDARISVINATSTNIDTLTVNTASTLNGLTTISDGRISVLNASTTLIDTLTLTNDLALAHGGTGASLSDPGADRLMFWDDSESAVAWLTAGTGITIDGTTISASGGETGSAGAWQTVWANTLAPTSTSAGLFVYASSTFNSTLRVNDDLIVDGTTLMVDASENRVGIGVGAPTAKLDVVNSADVIGLNIKANSTQNNNLLQLQNSSGEFLAGFTGTGGLLINVASSTALAIQNGSGSNVLTVNTAAGDNATTTIAGYLNVDANTLYVDAANNRVGIGTNAPESTLEISDSSNKSSLVVQAGIAQGGTNLFELQDTAGNYLSGFASSGALLINVASSTALEIQNGVGVSVLTVNSDNQHVIVGNTLRTAILNATSTNIDNLTVNSSSIFSGLSTFSDARIPVLNATSTNIDTLTVNTTINVPANSFNADEIEDIYIFNSGDTMTGNLIMGGSSANIALGSNYLSGDGGDEGIFVDSAGNVGIGTNSPGDILHIVTSHWTNEGTFLVGPSANSDINSRTRSAIWDNYGAYYEGLVYSSGSAGESSGFLFSRARGSYDSKSAVQEDDRLFFIVGRGYDGNSFENPVGFSGYVDGTVSNGVVPGVLQFETGTNSSNRTARMLINSIGSVGIATTTPGGTYGEKLTVAGSGYFTGGLYIDGLLTNPDARISVLNATTTNIDTLTVNTASTLNGLTIISDGRIATLNATSSLIDDLVVNRATSTNFYTSSFGLGSDYITDLTGTGLSVVDGVLTASGEMSDWQMTFGETAITPTSSVGLYVTASSTIAANFRVDGSATTTGSFYVGTDRLVVTEAGNVGIGVASPAAKLHVQGDLRVYDGGGSEYVLLSHDGSNASITASTGNVEIGTAGNDIYLGAVGSASNLVFEESAAILGQGANTITFGQSGDHFNLAVSGVTYWVNTLTASSTNIVLNASSTNDTMVVIKNSANGNEGPGARLVVEGAITVASSTDVAYFYNNFGGGTPSRSEIATSGDVYIRGDIEVDGTAYLSGGTSWTQGDLAENIPVNRLKEEAVDMEKIKQLLTGETENEGEVVTTATVLGDDLSLNSGFEQTTTTEMSAVDLNDLYAEFLSLPEAGDVLVVDPQNAWSAVKSFAAGSNRILGIVSTDPAGVLRGDMERLATDVRPLALSGTVPVKVSLENGPIKKGDLLTTAVVPGHAAKAIDKKAGIVGIALEDYMTDGLELISDETETTVVDLLEESIGAKEAEREARALVEKEGDEFLNEYDLLDGEVRQETAESISLKMGKKIMVLVAVRNNVVVDWDDVSISVIDNPHLGEDVSMANYDFYGNVAVKDLVVTGDVTIIGQAEFLAEATFKNNLNLAGALVRDYYEMNDNELKIGDAVYIAAPNKVALATADLVDENGLFKPAIGLVVAFEEIQEELMVAQEEGEAENSRKVKVAIGGVVGGFENLLPGAVYFLSDLSQQVITGEQLTEIASSSIETLSLTAIMPQTVGTYIQRLGVAESETSLLVMPSLDYQEYAESDNLPSVNYNPIYVDNVTIENNNQTSGGGGSASDSSSEETNDQVTTDDGQQKSEEETTETVDTDAAETNDETTVDESLETSDTASTEVSDEGTNGEANGEGQESSGSEITASVEPAAATE